MLDRPWQCQLLGKRPRALPFPLFKAIYILLASLLLTLLWIYYRNHGHVWRLWFETHYQLLHFKLWSTEACDEHRVWQDIFIMCACVMDPPPCVCVYTSWWVRVWILIVCEFLPPSQRFTRGYSWPLARNKQLEYSRAVASTSSSSSSSWHHFRPACLQLTFTLLPTAFHCFHGLHLPSFGLFCMLWLTVCWIVMYFHWSLLSDMSSFGSGCLLLVSFNSETVKLKFSPDLTTDILQHESFHSKKKKKLNTWTYE